MSRSFRHRFATTVQSDAQHRYRCFPSLDACESRVLLSFAAEIQGPAMAVPGQLVAYTLGTDADDPEGTIYRFAVDWEDDGVFDRTLDGPDGTIISRSFSETGTRNFVVEATRLSDSETSSTPGTMTLKLVPALLESSFDRGVAVLDSGHADLGLAFEDGLWDLHVHTEGAVVDGTPRDDEEFDADEIEIFVSDDTQIVTQGTSDFFDIPESLGLSQGDSFWNLFQGSLDADATGTPFLGIAAEEIALGVFEGDTVSLALSDVDGPGTFSLWSDGDGVVFDSVDGFVDDLIDAFPVGPGSHTHFNYAFSSPGVYKVELTASGTLAGTDEVTSGRAEYTFVVSEFVEPRLYTEGHADFGVSFEDGILDLHLHAEGATIDGTEIPDEEIAAHEVAVFLSDTTSVTTTATSDLFNIPESLGLVQGDPFWNGFQDLLSSAQADAPWLGVAAEEVPTGVFVGNSVRFALTDLDGPGEFTFWSNGSGVIWDSLDGFDEDTIDFPVGPGAHSHFNYAFSQPGRYKLEMTATGTLVADGSVISDVATFIFYISETPGDSTLFVGGTEGDDLIVLSLDDQEASLATINGEDSGPFDGVDQVVAFGLGGDDRIQTVGLGAVASRVEAGAGDDTVVTGAGADTVFGGAGDDLITGNDGDDELDGQEGDDVLEGNAGADTLLGDAGEDTLDGGSGNDRIIAGRNDDQVVDTLGDNFVRAGDGSDTITTGDGDDTIEGNRFPDEIDAGNGNNVVDGGGDDDTITAGDGDDILRGQFGDDLITGGDGDDTLLGGNSRDTLVGSVGEDFIDGGNGFDSILGGSGDDTLIDGRGRDTLDGGDGADTFQVNHFAASSITELARSGQGDHILRRRAPSNQAVLDVDVLRVDAMDLLLLFLNAGNDTLQVAANFAGLQVEVDGGDGTDTSSIPDEVAENFTLTNFED